MDSVEWMPEVERMPETEDAPVIMVTVDAEDAPAEGARVSLDYVRRPGGGLEFTWFATDPDGAWVVASVGEPNARPRHALPRQPEPPRSADVTTAAPERVRRWR